MDHSIDTPSFKNLETDAGAGASDLTVLHEASKLIGQSATPEIAISSILRLMSQMLGLNRGRVLLPSTTGDHIQIRYSYGLLDEERKAGVYKLGEGISGSVMKSGQPAVIQNIDEDPSFLFRAVKRKTLPQGVVSFISVPIMDGNSTIGVLAAHRLRMRARAIDADLMILRILATFIAQIISINNLIEERTSYLREENRELKDALHNHKTENGHGILGESQAIRDALRQISRVANTVVTVLLTGESGTGKERFSQVLHLNSARSDQPFIAINCAAIPEQLLESELFGHERGAFTGASNTKKGKVELANGGTLFLDEIGDLNMELQSKLLRILENQVIQRVGGVKDIPVDVRIITATHKNLQEAVNQGKFRLDLFYRLNVFPIHLPPLREREGDMRILASHFLLNANREYNRFAVLDKDVIKRLETYNWPGNIRQLENVIKRSVLISIEGTISVADIEMILRQESAINEHLEAGQRSEIMNLESTTHIANTNKTHTQENTQHTNPNFNHNNQVAQNRPYAWVRKDEAQTLTQALEQTGGNKTRAAAMLGMSARQFRYRLEKLGIPMNLSREE